jgi:endonuclease YncB( thermonuclease family)
MKWFILAILAVFLIAGCTQNDYVSEGFHGNTAPSVYRCPNGTAVDGGPSNCPLLSFCKGSARCFEGVIDRVVDGDTIVVNNESIRLAMINAPEYGEYGYEQALNLTSKYCKAGSTAIVDEDDLQNESYGRIVAKVYCDYYNVNMLISVSDYASVDSYYCNRSEFSSEGWTDCSV